MDLNNFFDTDIQAERSFNECLSEVKKNSSEILPIVNQKLHNNVPDTNKGFRLYQISQMLEELTDLAELEAESNDGIINNALAEQLDSLEILKKEKILNCAKVYLNMSAQEKALSEALDRLKIRIKRIQYKKDKIYNYIKSHMSEGETFEDDDCILSWRKETGTEVYNLNEIPDNYCKFAAEFADQRILDYMRKNNISCEKTPLIKDKIAPALKNGKEIPGVKLKTGKALKIS